MPTGTICTHDGCTKPGVARRLCSAHYQAAWKAGALGAHEKLPPRVKDPKVCPPDHKHADSLVCYNLHQCRCTPCGEHRMKHEERRRKDKAYGRYDTGLVDVAPAREHLLMLSEYGIGYKRVAELAGLGTTPVRNIIWGRQDPGPRKGEMLKRVKRETAEAILAVQPIVDNLGDRQPIPALGAHRRIHALAARGWSLSKIAARLDMTVGNFWKALRSDQVSAGLHRRIATLYEELWDQVPPHDDWHQAAAYTRTVNHAKKRGWLPPLAWDDIDTDPEPERDVVQQGRASADEVLDDIEFLLEGGESPEQVATIIGRKTGTIAKLAERNGRRDLANVFGSIDKRVAA
ncbi:MAG: hypothetical protein K0S49_46 [Microbacterium sp.]|jgi:hypothetical protein|nr:hypothetical protein [Microbacterium sp.]